MAFPHGIQALIRSLGCASQPGAVHRVFLCRCRHSVSQSIAKAKRRHCCGTASETDEVIA
jgi:hypothetical protein